MFSASRSPVVLGLASVIVSAHAAAADPGAGAADRATAPPAASVLPEPPLQRAAWRFPQTRIPGRLLQAVDLLFSQGMADPRGCEYREIEVASSSDRRIKTRGWVLPTEEPGARRYAVCWTGLVHPLASVGDKADVQADMAPLIEGKRSRRNDSTSSPESPHFSHVVSEAYALSHEAANGLELCLLLRSGNVATAEAYWTELPYPEADRYLQWARLWAWYAFERAVVAHMRGDHGTSAAVAQLLSDAREKIEATAAERGFQRPTHSGPDALKLPYLLFLGAYPARSDPLSVLLADSQRRVRAERPMPLEDALKLADQTRRIAALIRLLEEIDERQWGDPGSVNLADSPIIKALEREGDAAVEPLLACFETDDRLTRSVSHSRRFQPDRRLIPVYEAAYVALAHVLQTSHFGPTTTHGPQYGNREAMARELRGFWQRARGRTPAERWYDTLADDNAEPRQWVEAALRIVRPVDVDVRGGWVNIPDRKPGEVPPIRGEELRGVRNPSVAELMARRVPQIAASAPHTSESKFRAGDATRVALALVRWEPESAGPVLRDHLKHCRALLDRWKPHGDASLLLRSIADLSGALSRIGDAESFKEYCDWLKSQSPQEPIARQLLEPLWRKPGDPHSLVAVEWLFNHADSAWRCLPRAEGYHWSGAADPLVVSPLVGMPPFRAGLSVNLADRGRIGVVRVDESSVILDPDRGGSASVGITDAMDPLRPGPEDQRIARVCDWYAWQLSRLDGTPRFELYWPEDVRDAAIKELRTFLDEWGDRFRYNAMQKILYDPPFNPPRIIFPQRDRPATAADVEARTAIFSFPADARVRVVPLEPFPRKAKWKTLERFPVTRRTWNPETRESRWVQGHDQEGLIWQAEEILEDGQWRRYYGFVGRHVVARVPAAEIDFGEDG